jgi:hypothetical protein
MTVCDRLLNVGWPLTSLVCLGKSWQNFVVMLTAVEALVGNIFFILLLFFRRVIGNVESPF